MVAMIRRCARRRGPEPSLPRSASSTWTALAALAAMGLASGCNDGIAGLQDVQTPLATLVVRLAPGTDTSDMVAPRVALIWGGQTIGETFCWGAMLPSALGLPSDASLTAVVARGCRDPLGFYPDTPGESAPLEADGTATIVLKTLPSADVMVGDLTARVGYATIVLYDDHDQDGRLGIRFPWWGRGGPGGDGGPGGEGGPGGKGGGSSSTGSGTTDGSTDGSTDALPDDSFGDEPTHDTIHAASFRSMTVPDARLAFREGAFDSASAFYPRNGCPAPPVGYSLLKADGFSLVDAVKAFAAGGLPTTKGCAETSLGVGGTAVVEVTLAREATETLQSVACIASERGGSGTGASTYRAPPDKATWLKELPWVCQPVGAAGAGPLGGLLGEGSGGAGKDGTGDGSGKPTGGLIGEGGPAQMELIVGYPSDSCPATRHYLLRGCRNDPLCETPEWDLTDVAPSWWPCANAGATP